MRAPVATLDNGFDRFWEVYPKHVGKKDARKAWTKLAPTADVVDKILDAVRWQRTTPKWMKDGGEFIPYPATWLRAERWDDEPFETRPMLGKRTQRILTMLEAIRAEET